jgi:hypothetical protein
MRIPGNGDFFLTFYFPIVIASFLSNDVVESLLFRAVIYTFSLHRCTDRLIH